MRRVLTRALALGYPVLLLIFIATVRFAGPHFWQAELALYVPRALFALPIVALSCALLAYRMRGLLWTQLVSALLVIFPLMGFVVAFPSSAQDPSKVIRILSYNANFAAAGQANLARQVLELKPEIAVFQQLYRVDQLAPLLASRLPFFQSNGEFAIASRFALKRTIEPEWLPLHGRLRSPRYIVYELDTKLGPLVIYNVHPVSPSYQFRMLRSGGLKAALASGRLFSLDRHADIGGDSERRRLQVHTIAEKAQRETRPVVIAGDTNLPDLSATLSELAAFRDGFSSVGFGFGHTFPSQQPWMRIDRIFASRALEFRRFAIGRSQASDHRCVTADLELVAR